MKTKAKIYGCDGMGFDRMRCDGNVADGIKVKAKGRGSVRGCKTGLISSLTFFWAAAGLNAPRLSVMSLAFELRDATRPLLVPFWCPSGAATYSLVAISSWTNN